eukprot:UN07280
MINKYKLQDNKKLMNNNKKNILILNQKILLKKKNIIVMIIKMIIIMNLNKVEVMLKMIKQMKNQLHYYKSVKFQQIKF